VLFGGWQAACRLDCYKIHTSVGSLRPHGSTLSHIHSYLAVLAQQQQCCCPSLDLRQTLPCVELAIRRWTRHHLHNAHHVSSTAEEKAPPGHYREHTSRSILDIRGSAMQYQKGDLTLPLEFSSLLPSPWTVHRSPASAMVPANDVLSWRLLRHMLAIQGITHNPVTVYQ
jgi:hypothetical protein